MSRNLLPRIVHPRLIARHLRPAAQQQLMSHYLRRFGYIDAMEKKVNRSAVGALALIGMLIFYPLSAGPASWLWNQTESETARHLLETMYEPLELLPPPLGELLENWVDLWE
jgi:hypothetical protein